MIARRIATAVLSGALLIAGGACRRAPSAEEAAEARDQQIRTALLARLIPPQQQLFKSIERSGYRPAPVGVVVADVFAFREALGPGAALRGDPLAHLANGKLTGAEAWLRAPASKRVFVAGFGSDGPPIQMSAAMLKADGYEVFLYDFCPGQTGLMECPTETVGAYFATAGHALIGTTEAAVRSGLVREEAAGVPPLPDSVKRAVLITPTQAATIGESAAADFAAVEMWTRSLKAPAGG